MGMFDTLKSEYPLPGLPQELLAIVQFQTKSLDNTMDVFTIKPDGRLVHDMVSYHPSPEKTTAQAQLEQEIDKSTPDYANLTPNQAVRQRRQQLSLLTRLSQLFQPSIDAYDALFPFTGIINFYCYPPSKQLGSTYSTHLEYYAYFKNGLLKAIIKSDPELDVETSEANLMSTYRKNILEKNIPHHVSSEADSALVNKRL